MARWVPSNEDWNRYQGRIKQLYLGDGKTLRDVMEFMETEYNFQATVKMFKNRLTKWGYDRKYKKRDLVANNTTKTHRLSVGDEEESEQMSERSDSVVEPPEMPRLVRISEPLLDEIRYFFCASFRSGIWVSDGRDKPCRSIKATERVYKTISDLPFDKFSGYGDHHRRILHMREEPSKAKDFIMAEIPETIPDLIELSLRLIEQGEYETVHTIFWQFQEVSAASNAKAASIYRIMTQHCASDCVSFEEVMAHAWRLVVTDFQYFLGDLHATTVRCHVRWLRYFAQTSVCDVDICSSKCDHLEYSRTVLTDLFKRCEEDRSPSSVRSEMVLQTTVNVLLAGGMYAEAEATCRQIIDRTEMELGNHILTTALESLSVAQWKQEEFSLAERTLRKLVDLSARSWGFSHGRTLYYVSRLEDCLIKSGKTDEVTTIWDYAPGRLSPSLHLVA